MSSPGQYSNVWKAVLPIIKRYAPHAIQVAGEISPWGITFLQSAFRHGLPGAQAVSGHPYPMFHTKEPYYANSLRQFGLPVLFTEGACGPLALGAPHGCLPVARAAQLGSRMALDWMK